MTLIRFTLCIKYFSYVKQTKYFPYVTTLKQTNNVSWHNSVTKLTLLKLYAKRKFANNFFSTVTANHLQKGSINLGNRHIFSIFVLTK